MIAQTNLQLFSQLHSAGWSAEEVAPVWEAYGLAIELFAGRYRGNRRPFICHLVGTASIGATVGMGSYAVAACLLHAANEQGVFPSGRKGAHPVNRAYVRTRVGEGVEDLINAYQVQPWNETAIEKLIDAASLAPATALVATMRLADLLDDLMDAGCVSTPGKFDQVARRRIAGAIVLAGRLQLPKLATQLQEAEAANAAAEWAPAVVRGQAASFSVKPSLFSVLRAHVFNRFAY